MSDKTGIEWTDATWNPIRGCSRVSQGCVHCYAEGVARRFSGPGQPYAGLIDARTGGWNGTVRFVPNALDQPLRWKRPRRIFVNSMSDLFHENVTDDQIDRIFAVMALSPQHTFQILTKRPERMLAWATYQGDGRWGFVDGHARTIWREYSGKNFPAGKMLPFRPLPNVWLGVSVENQAAADERIPLLLKTPAAIRFLSCEPLLGELDLTQFLIQGDGTWLHERETLDWVICGGESGQKPRPMHPAWARELRNQCREAGVPFFFKQWGAWVPVDLDSDEVVRDWFIVDSGGGVDIPDYRTPHEASGEVAMRKCHKKDAGRLLDGHLHDDFPRERA